MAFLPALAPLITAGASAAAAGAGIYSALQKPKAPPPPKPPGVDQGAVQAAAAAERQRVAGARGRSATIFSLNPSAPRQFGKSLLGE